MAKKTSLSKSMTLSQFDNGYWYATELRAFAITLGIPSASRLRKDELERALKHFISTGESKTLARRSLSARGIRDVDKGLRLDLPVVNYTSNRETKAFIEREAAKLEPGFTRASGTRYLLNRWREEQLAAGKRITYRDLITQAIALNKTKRGPLRILREFRLRFHGGQQDSLPRGRGEGVARSQSDGRAQDVSVLGAIDERAWSAQEMIRNPPAH